jgi:hypothetical protein
MVVPFRCAMEEGSVGTGDEQRAASAGGPDREPDDAEREAGEGDGAPAAGRPEQARGGGADGAGDEVAVAVAVLTRLRASAATANRPGRVEDVQRLDGEVEQQDRDDQASTTSSRRPARV